jgi:hypothetical protein
METAELRSPMQTWRRASIEPILIGLVVAVALFPDRAASAQTSASVGSQTPPPAAPSGDDLGYVPPFSGSVLAAPMRLTLEGSIFPKASGFPQCASLEDDVGNSVGGIPVQHYTDWQLTPRLVLSAFTQLGCPIDAVPSKDGLRRRERRDLDRTARPSRALPECGDRDARQKRKPVKARGHA